MFNQKNLNRNKYHIIVAPSLMKCGLFGRSNLNVFKFPYSKNIPNPIIEIDHLIFNSVLTNFFETLIKK